jgi:enoyl-CoA hydratase
MAEVPSDEVLVERRSGRGGDVGLLILNRQRALNALAHRHFKALRGALEDWAADPSIKAVVVRAAPGKAFSAGGDIRFLYEARQRGAFDEMADYYAHEYGLDRLVHRYPKPYIPLMDGIVMGGGAGIAVNCPGFRIVTERTLLAMPETSIGYFPDVGASHFLSRTPGYLGLCMGLASIRIGAADAIHAGLADHFVHSNRLDDLVEALAASTDPADILNRMDEPPGPPELAAKGEIIDRCFDGGTVAEIMDRLASIGDNWARKTLETLEARPPLSLAVTHRAITAAASMGFDDCLRMEYRLFHHFIRGHDFLEGVRAAIIDKDGAPKWRPDSLEAVTERDVDALFAAPCPFGELPLP